MAIKLSKSQLRVLKAAYDAYHDDSGYGTITTSRLGGYSISPNTCKSLVAFDPPLLKETDYTNQFRITTAGRREYERQRTPAARKQADPADALARWVSAVGTTADNRARGDAAGECTEQTA